MPIFLDIRGLLDIRALRGRWLAERLAQVQIKILGVELTQAIQYFRPGGQAVPAEEANNSISLIAGKPTGLRLYAAFRPFWGSSYREPLFTGFVRYPGGELEPVNGPIQGGPAEAMDRGQVNHTLNFLLPAEATALAEDGAESLAFPISVCVYFAEGRWRADKLGPRRELTATFYRMPRLRVHIVRVRGVVRGERREPPSLQACWESFRFVEKAYPIAAIERRGDEVMDFNEDLQDKRGWYSLASELRRRQILSHSSDVYVGFVDGPSHPNLVQGAAVQGAAVCFVSEGIVLAHELGHVFGRCHAPCGTDDACWFPTCGNYAPGSICEYGWDPVVSEVFSPETCADFMSYCGCWVSPYTYTQLKNSITYYDGGTDTPGPSIFDPVIGALTGAVPGSTPALRPETLYLNVRLHRNRRVELLPSYHLPDRYPGRVLGTAAPFRCELVDSDGMVLESVRCHYLTPLADLNDPWVEFNEQLRWHPAAYAITFVREGEEQARIEIEAETPKVVIRHFKIDLSLKRGLIEWEAIPPATSHLVRFSPDAGQTWRALATDLRDARWEIDMTDLTQSKECVLQVASSSGIRTGTAETESFVI